MVQKKIGIVGKPSAGKTTFLNALCGLNAKTADYPFTTIDPNEGVAYVSSPCPCKELEVQCEPRNSSCENGIRRIPIRIIDVAGLVPGAHEGKGLGNQFLGDLADADALIHVLDCSGSLDFEGQEVESGSHDPTLDIEFLEKEIALWMVGILKKGWDRLVRRSDSEKAKHVDLLYEKFSGLKITKTHIMQALASVDLPSSPREWSDDHNYELCRAILHLSKPFIHAANKIDRPSSKPNLEKLIQVHGEERIIPTSAAVEVFLQKASEKNAIEYNSKIGSLKILDDTKLNPQELNVIQKAKMEILEPYGSTGVLKTLNTATFGALKLIVVYPVADTTKFSDHDGRVLPDAFLVPEGTTAKGFAEIIHQDLAKSFIHAIDAKTKRRLAESHELNNNDVIRIVSAA
ncbi:MAG: redox-regulated ATPase YchF [Candidatus Thorarchaeota archaeon]